jgi:hypothetical protein
MRQGSVVRTPSRARKSLVFVLVCGAALLALPSAASAAIRLVDDDTGVDAGDCTATPCLTFTYAYNQAAATGDTISFDDGVYDYADNGGAPFPNIAKGVEIAGAGTSTTIFDGGDAHSLPTNGTINVTSPDDVILRDFTIRNPGTSVAGPHGTDQHRAINVKTTVSAAVAPTYTVTRVRFEGEANFAGNDYGFTVVGSTSDLVIDDNEFVGQDANPVLLERNQGSVVFNDNTITRFAGAGGAAIFDANYSPALPGVAGGISEAHVFTANVIDATGGATSSGISVNAGWTAGTPPLGGYERVDISGNTITGVGSATAGIAVSNDTTDPDGSDAEIQNANVLGNTLTGAGGSSPGLRFRGLVTDIDVDGNQITGFDRGIEFTDALTAAIHAPGPSDVHFNRLVDNTTWQINAAAGGPVNAENNWWGCNEGPNVNIADCGTVAGAGVVTYDPWLVLRISAAPTSVEVGGNNSTVTANLNFNSDGANAGTVHPNGFPVAWATDLGTIAPPSSPLAAGIATSTLTSGPIAGTANPAATVDNETVSTPVEFTDNGIPQTQIDSGPTNGVTIANNTANFTFSSPNDPAATFECRIDSADPADFAPCVTPFTTPALADGPHVFEVRAVDVNNNVDPSPSRVTFVVDTTPDTGGVLGAASDKLEGACDNEIRGNGAANRIKGTKGGDRILGFGAGDTLRGLGGYDCLKGSTGDDNLDGGVAGDILQGGAGDDTARSRDGKRDKINCGAGDDTALVDQRDIVKNCETILVRRQLKVG